MTLAVGQWVRCRYGAGLPEHLRIGKVVEVEDRRAGIERVLVAYVIPDVGLETYSYTIATRGDGHVIMPDQPTEEELAQWILVEISR